MIVVYTTSTGQALTDTLKSDGRPIDLTGYTVKFNMRHAESETLKVTSKTATIVNAAEGQVSITWSSTDIDTAGEYQAWWELTSGPTHLSTDEFLVVVDTHAPGVRTTTGTIYRKLQGFLPITIDALRDSSHYGDSQIQDRINEVKMRLLGSTLPVEDEIDLDVRVQTYLAKLAAIEIIPVGVDYWANQHISVTTGGGGTNEIATYPDRIAALWKIYERYLLEVREDATTIEGILGTQVTVVPSFATPQVSDGAATDDFVTPNPNTDYREYAYPGKRTDSFNRGWWRGW